MTLSFMQHWKSGKNKGKPTFFVDKIWSSFDEYTFLACFDTFSIPHKEKVGRYIESNKKAKSHSIRFGKRQWIAGNDIHFAINNRTKNYFRFAPITEVVSVQKIEFELIGGLTEDAQSYDIMNVFIDEKNFGSFDRLKKEVIFGEDNLQQLAINDGFESVEDFFEYFNENATGQLIHWTDLTY